METDYPHFKSKKIEVQVLNLPVFLEIGNFNSIKCARKYVHGKKNKKPNPTIHPAQDSYQFMARKNVFWKVLFSPISRAKPLGYIPNTVK